MWLFISAFASSVRPFAMRSNDYYLAEGTGLAEHYRAGPGVVPGVVAGLR